MEGRLCPTLTIPGVVMYLQLCTVTQLSVSNFSSVPCDYHVGNLRPVFVNWNWTALVMQPLLLVTIAADYVWS